MKSYKYGIACLTLAAAAVFGGCDNDDPGNDIYNNSIYLESSTRMTQMYVSTENVYEQTLTAAIPKPVDHDIHLSYAVEEHLVAEYNTMYDAQAVILPPNHYLFSSKKDVISAGDVRSGSIILEFVDVLDLNKEVLYVLPVSLSEADIPVLRTRATNFYVFRGANLVNIVGYMVENYCEVTWPNPSVVSNMQQMSVELLVNSNWGDGTDAGINALIGIEGYFLLRMGDAGAPSDRLQLCFGPEAGLPLGPTLPTNEWVHLAVTYDMATRYCRVYVNGIYQEASSGQTGKVFDDAGIDFTTTDVEYPGFHIGKAYNNSRWICGYVAECRIWDRVLTAEELSDQFIRPYYVDPKSDGLVAYWKFNEGSGRTVIDRTGNGNDAVAPNPIVWTEMALPE